MTPASHLDSSAVSWHQLTIADLFILLGTEPTGLTPEEASQRLETYGRNELPAARGPDPWTLLLGQFKSVLVCVLIAAAIVSGWLGDRLDCAAILAVLALNAAIGFQQEFRAEKAIAALKSSTAPRARVLRAKQAVSLPAAEVVPGDVLLLEAGDVIAADARLVDASALRCVESALTGESQPALKRAASRPSRDALPAERDNMVFMGTGVAAGSGRAVAVATGRETEIGRIAALLDQPKGITPLQQRLEAFGRVLVWLALGAVAILFLLGAYRGTPWGEMFLTSVSLAVAAVPEGLPAIVTIALAIGVRRMARRRALIRRLPAVETLGCANVICTDKTGTLTAGQMTVEKLFLDGESFEVTGEGFQPMGEVLSHGDTPQGRQARLLCDYADAAASCTEARIPLRFEENGLAPGDPTEVALVVFAAKVRGDVSRSPSTRVFPFEPELKNRAALLRRESGETRLVVNGAPESLLDCCTYWETSHGVHELDDAARRLIQNASVELAEDGLRVIGTAYRDLLKESVPNEQDVAGFEVGLVFLGLAGMRDQPRPEVRDAVARCRAAGVRAVMITGDHPRTALAIAREVGLHANGAGVLTGAEIDRLSQSELQNRLADVAVFARVTPEHKLRIVQGWRARDCVVAMTGDGVNDAPAVKQADIGIAMGRGGTEVTRQAADMVITDDNFATIVAAVEEGRGVYANIRKTLQYLLASNSGEVMVVAASILCGLPLPLLPVHLLWVNLVTDSLPALCLAAMPAEADVMQRPPRGRDTRLAGGSFLFTVGFTGLLMAAGTFLAYSLASRWQVELTLARSYAFEILIVSQLFLSWGMRSDYRPAWSGVRSGRMLAPVIGVSLAVQWLCHHSASLRRLLHLTPLATHDWLLLGLIALVPLAGYELLKGWRRKTRAELPAS